MVKKIKNFRLRRTAKKRSSKIPVAGQDICVAGNFKYRQHPFPGAGLPVKKTLTLPSYSGAESKAVRICGLVTGEEDIFSGNNGTEQMLKNVFNK